MIDAHFAVRAARLTADGVLSALGAVPEPADQSALIDPLLEKFAQLSEQVSAALAAPNTTDPALAELKDQVAAISELLPQSAPSAQPQIDLSRERDGLVRTSTALQTILRRLDQQSLDLSGKIDSLPSDHAEAPDLENQIQRLGDQLDASMSGRLEAVSAELSSLNDAFRTQLDKPAAQIPDLAQERMGLERLSLAMQSVIRRLDQHVTVFEGKVTGITVPEAGPEAGPGVTEALEDISSKLTVHQDKIAADIAERWEAVSTELNGLSESFTAHLDRPEPRLPDLVQERTGIERLSLALQTVVRRLDQHVTEFQDKIAAIAVPASELDSGPDAGLDSGQDTGPHLTETLGEISRELQEAKARQTAHQDRIATDIEEISRLVMASKTSPASIDISFERDGLQRISLALQTTLRRLDQQCSALQDQTDRFAGLTFSDAPGTDTALLDAISERIDQAVAPLVERVTRIEDRQAQAEGLLQDLLTRTTGADTDPEDPAKDKVLSDLALLRKDLRSLLTRYRNQLGRLEDMMNGDGASDQGGPAGSDMNEQMGLALAEILAQLNRIATVQGQVH